MRDRFPLQNDRFIAKSLLLTLGLLFSVEDRERFNNGQTPNPLGGFPYYLSNNIGLRISATARSFGLSVDELVNRLVSAWMEAVCDFDGIPLPGTKEPK